MFSKAFPEGNTTMCNSRPAAFGGGAAIGILGGLVGLGGAEFRLPLLIGGFGFAAIEAVIVNKAMSLVVVLAALVFRTRSIPLDLVAGHLDIVVNLLAGSLLGAWIGASWALRLRSATLFRVIAALLLLIAVVLVLGHEPGTAAPLFAGSALVGAGVAAGFAIGVVAALLGVAGGELLIPTLVLLFGLDIKLAGSLSLAVSLPTMLVAFARYSRDGSFATLRRNRGFVVAMAAGSVVGALLGGLCLGLVPTAVLLPILAVILVISAVKVWRHA